MPELASGTLVDGRYRVLSRLGTGGMADVFLAEDEQLSRKVAVKLLHRRFAEDPGFVERFRREAQAAAGLQHPNVVGVYDRGAFDGTYYIAMEYLPGRTLKQVIRQDAPVDPVRAIDITIQILKAARFAHRRGVIHRDLKPHNVIVDDSDHAKVTDFGIARAGASDMTETGSIMGTAQYLSPEQAQGHAVSASADLYSIGIVLYELLTGRVPFEAESAVTIALKHVAEPPAPPRELNLTIPPELEQVVLWSLNKSPAERPPDADAFIGALEQARRRIVARTRGETTTGLPILAGVAVVDAASAAPPEAEWASENGGPAPAEAPPERKRQRWPWLLAALLVLLLAGGGAVAYLMTRPAEKLVPNVVLEMASVATAQLENAGFNPTINNVIDSHPTGTVIRQSPVAGTKARQGTIVTLTVSAGPGTVSIPPVDGLAHAAATRTLRQAGLKVRVETLNSSDVPDGQAIRTDPAAGFTVQVGSSVTLFVSSGPATGTVPDVGGLSETAARQKLSAAGFAASTTTRSSERPAGTVIGQDPGAGAVAALGTAVTLVTASAPPTATVPNVTGQTAPSARGTLTGAGFTVTQHTGTVSTQDQDGIVISQNPTGGSTERKGSAVTIIVGRFTPPTSTASTSSSSSSTTTTTTSSSSTTSTTPTSSTTTTSSSTTTTTR